jgi:hypothetical protein
LSHRKKALFGFVALLRRRWKTALSLFAVVAGLGAFADNLGKILGLGESILHWLNPCPLQANITEEIGVVARIAKMLVFSSTYEK